MRLTKKKAKELSIKKWKIFYEHPELNFSDGYESYFIENHPKLWGEIKDHCFDCSLCSLYFNTGVGHECNLECPLIINGEDCCSRNAYWNKWTQAKTSRVRKKYASLILQTIKDWTW